MREFEVTGKNFDVAGTFSTSMSPTVGITRCSAAGRRGHVVENSGYWSEGSSKRCGYATRQERLKIIGGRLKLFRLSFDLCFDRVVKFFPR